MMEPSKRATYEEAIQKARMEAREREIPDYDRETMLNCVRLLEKAKFEA